VVGAGECRLNFAITYHSETITGAVTWTEEGPALRVPPETFGMIDGKPTGSAVAMFGAINVAQESCDWFGRRNDPPH
jgi:hypothetical protein